MSASGIHYAITEEEAVWLRNLPDQAERMEHLRDVLFPTYIEQYGEFVAEGGGYWELLHCALTYGADSGQKESVYPLDQVVLGGESLDCEGVRILSLKSPELVHAIAEVLPTISKSEFLKRCFAIPVGTCDKLDDNQHFDEAWAMLGILREFYSHAAEEERYVLFATEE